ncbi:SusC/RagA family TonB-linked outer membrane protein [Fulvivirga maritima]|uniref:SusC/RagA family TonB-linked outer membrane protein n=1 Tax=Fulvivirga maritima TaxID=2904247 RepID=UPI001F339F2E|nr:SusC/RagA family TonB-linked outer membrane protein [Fulvivirga maritima]UII27683.1 SusC/RagA family TonB-linked outer membrane protein [Fulvivirga maritima]
MKSKILPVIWKTIKLSTCAFFIVFTSFSALIAETVEAQSKSVSETYINIDFEEADVEKIFDEIEKQTEFVFVYGELEFKNLPKIRISPGNVSVESVLLRISNITNLQFYKLNNNISVKKGGEKAPSGAKLIGEVNRKAEVVKGQVISEDDGLPLTGVSVLIKGTTRGAVTDLDGKFSVEVEDENATLVFSFIGYETQEVIVGNQTELMIVLVPSIESLNEIVVTAMGIEKEERSLTYNVQELSGETINQVADANFVNNLNGKIAGVRINSSSAGMGGSSRVVMRGAKSISGNNNALYVIDGIPMPNLSVDQPSDLYSGAGQTGDGISNLNPEDIESISVLSGAAAAALYGSSAANGVVLVTTKKGNKDHTSINITNNTLFLSPLVLPEFQNTYGVTERGGESYDSWGERLETPSSYDPEDFFRTGVNVTNSVSLSTGSERSQTYVSAGSVNGKGIVHNNEYDRYNFSVRNSTELINNLTMDLGFMSSYVEEQNMTAQGQYFNPLVAVYLFPPGDDFEKVKTFERYNASRNFQTQFWPYGDQGVSLQNPYWITERNNFNNQKERYMTNLGLKYKVAEGVNVSSRIKMDRSRDTYEEKFNASTNTLFASENGYYSLNETGTRQIYGEFLVNIDRNVFNNNINLNATIGTNFENISYDQNMYGGNLQGVANLFTYANVMPATAERSQSGYETKKQAVFSSVQLGYQNLVYLDLTARNDWPSTLAGSNTSSFFYPSVGVTGIMSDIFNINSSVVSLIKLRASYSEVGNEPDIFITIPTYSLTGGYPETQTRLPNTDLKPERTKAWEAGLNVELFNNSLSVNATLYQSSTYNQFFEPTLSTTSGYTSVIVNAGQVDNKGIEVTANYNKSIGEVTLHSYLTYTLNRNEIIELLPGWRNPITGDLVVLDELDMGGTGSYKMLLREGGSISDIYVNTLRADEHGAIFVDPSTQAVEAESNNYIRAGNSAPKYYMSLGNNISWNRFSLGFLFSARVGGVVVSNTQALMDAFGTSATTAEAREAGGALVNGKRIPAMEYYKTVGGVNGGIGSQYTYSATNVRLSEVTFSYQVPVTFQKWIKGMTVSFVGKNLLMIYNKAPFDPEMTANTGTYYQGVDYFMMPSLRSMGFSVNLKL